MSNPPPASNRAAARRPPEGQWKRARRRRRAALVAIAIALCVSAAGLTQLFTRSLHDRGSAPQTDQVVPSSQTVAPPPSPTAGGVATEPPATTTTGHPATPGPTDPVVQAVTLLNAERVKAGCRAVTQNSTLSKAAQLHSADMVLRGYFGHTSPDGFGPGERLTAAGYRWASYGENIARGHQDTQSVVHAWISSPPNRANIVNCAFTEAGAGTYATSDGPVWTLILASTEQGPSQTPSSPKP
ncbi:CAP domain-containing protein [Streptomyces sp. NPDC005444]